MLDIHIACARSNSYKYSALQYSTVVLISIHNPLENLLMLNSFLQYTYIQGDRVVMQQSRAHIIWAYEDYVICYNISISPPVQKYSYPCPPELQRQQFFMLQVLCHSQRVSVGPCNVMQQLLCHCLSTYLCLFW